MDQYVHKMQVLNCNNLNYLKKFTSSYSALELSPFH